MVWAGRKAQVLALMGMDIREANRPPRRRAFSAVLTRVAYTSPSPGRARRGDILIPTAVLPVAQTVLRLPAVADHPQQSPGPAPPGPFGWLREGWPADTGVPGLTSPEACPASPSPPSPPVSPRGKPNPPGYSRPAPRRSRCSVFRPRPLFFQCLSLTVPRFPAGNPPRARAARTSGPVLLDPHHIVPSAVHYGLAQVPLRIPCVHGQQLQPGQLSSSWPSLSRNTPGSHRLSGAGHWARHSFKPRASALTITGGLPLWSTDCLAHFPSAGTLNWRPAATRDTQPAKSRLQLLPRDCGQCAGDGGGARSFVPDKPQGDP